MAESIVIHVKRCISHGICKTRVMRYPVISCGDRKYFRYEWSENTEVCYGRVESKDR